MLALVRRPEGWGRGGWEIDQPAIWTGPGGSLARRAVGLAEVNGDPPKERLTAFVSGTKITASYYRDRDGEQV